MAGTEEEFTQESVTAKTLLLAQQNDSKGIEALLFAIQTSDPEAEVMQTLIETLLTHDFAAVGAKVLGQGIINDWVDENVALVVAELPNIFEQWAQPTPNVVAQLGKALVGLDDADKVALLRGEETSIKPQMRLHDFLRKNPRFWDELSPAWVGAKDSELRQAACDLGWTPRAFIGMARHFFSGLDKHAGAWVNAMEYPYSLAMAVAWTSLREPSKLPPGTEKRQVSKAIFSTRCVAQANPLDVALAKIILRVISSNYGVVRDAAAAEASEKDVAHLEGVVDMHMTLGAMDALMHSLADGLIPGQSNEATIALPEFDTPEKT